MKSGPTSGNNNIKNLNEMLDLLEDANLTNEQKRVMIAEMIQIRERELKLLLIKSRELSKPDRYKNG